MLFRMAVLASGLHCMGEISFWEIFQPSNEGYEVHVGRAWYTCGEQFSLLMKSGLGQQAMLCS